MPAGLTLAAPSDPAILLLAQGGGQTYGLSWAIVLMCVILGLIVTLRPNHRTSEIKKSKEH